MKKFYLKILLTLLLFSFVSNVYASDQKKILFDRNGGSGLECDSPTSYESNEMCSGYVDKGTKVKFPSSSLKMYGDNGILMGWTKVVESGEPQCVSTYDGNNYSSTLYSIDDEYEVTDDTDFYACYNLSINGIRYAQSGANAADGGENIPCGAALNITECYKRFKEPNDYMEFCKYDAIGDDDSKWGIVYRDKLALTEQGASNTCSSSGSSEPSTSTTDTINDIRYGTTDAIIDTSFNCGDELYITTCTKESDADEQTCNFTKVNGVSKSGTVKRQYIKEAKDAATNICGTGNEKIDKCSNSVQKNIKNTHTFEVCYNKNYSDSEVQSMISDKGIVICGLNYTLDTTSTRASGEATCGNKNCIRNYTVNCKSNKPARPTLSVVSGIVGNDGYGQISVKASASGSNKIVGYYVSDEYTVPTNTSSWESTEGEFSIRTTPGIKYVWVKDNKGNISASESGVVIDTVNTNTTIKKLELRDSNNSITPPSSGVSYNSNEISSNDYVRLSNNLNKESKALADGFNPFTAEYKVSVDTPTITVFATLTSTDSNYVSGYEPRTVNLKYGVNTILIKIQNKEGKVRTYTILVTRKDDRTSDNTLSDISVNVGKINFNSNVTDYKITIPKNTENVEVKSTISSDLASYISGYEPGNVSINDDTTVKILKIKSQTGSTRTYVLTFVKEGTDGIEDKSLQLSGLTIPGVYIAFEESVANYSLTVGYEDDLIDVYTPLNDKDSSAIISIKNKNDSNYKLVSNMGIKLDVGENYLEIKVTNKAGKKAYYRLTIIRKEFGLDVSDDSSLKDLKVLGYDIKFNPTKKDYAVRIKTEKSLVITAQPTSNRAEVFIRGNEELTGFSTVRVKVVAENGKNETYSIDIKKDPFNKTIEIASIVAGGVIILISSCIIIIKKKITSNREYIEE